MPEDHDWDGNDDDLWALFCFVAGILIALVIVFDGATHYITHKLHHEAHEHKHMLMKQFRDKMYFLLWSSLQSELMVLGFLAFSIWLGDQAGLFHAIYNLEGHHPDKESQEATHPFYQFPCRRAAPQTPHELLEVVEHTHMVLFISMVFYFIFLSVALGQLLRNLRRYEVQEFNEAAGQAATDLRVLKRLQQRRHYLLRRVAISFEEELSQRPHIKDSVNAGKLDFTGFLEATSEELIAKLVEFPLTTWLLVLAYFMVLAICAEVFCFSLEFSFSMILDGIYAISTLYTCIRLLIFWRRVDRDQQNAWPLQALDRATSFIIGPGIAGFYPWSVEPSEKAAVSCIQAMLFFQVVWFAYLIIPNPVTQERVHLSVLPGGMPVQVILRGFCLGLWAWILPQQLEVFALPPFISDEEVALLFEILERYPHGVETQLESSSPRDQVILRRMGGGQ